MLNHKMVQDFILISFPEKNSPGPPIKHNFVLANAATMTRAESRDRTELQDRIEDRPRPRIEDSEASTFSYKYTAAKTAHTFHTHA